ncbi:hypothetical protein LPY66_04030 [Dehalobacter sp. DCM]|uniref:hypothetical protein n=1 Tax=Dehalobacter sp. DCM TaxID=2907827 RepID=UPI003082128F|nr:hypothetical protein LPY66_04030 [Dehalobacter sp. DCM]
MDKKIIKLKRGGNGMMKQKFKSLNLSKLNGKKTTIVSSEKALEDITPINWSKDVLSGKKKVRIDTGK